ncbi:MAG: ATP-binding protein [Eubacterium sp.]
MFDGFIEQISKNANRIVDGDYIKDGLYYCHLCNTPKQYRLNVSGKEYIVNSMCRCAKAKNEKENEEKEKHMRIELRRTALGGDELLNWDFEHDDMKSPKLTNALKKYCEQFDYFKAMGKGLLLYGPVGTGKTFATAEIINELAGKGRRCKLTSVTRVVNDMQKTFDRRYEYIDKLNRYELIVLDDFSSERKTEYVQEAVYQVVNARYMSGLPMIITTNLTADEMKHCADITFQRTYSRISEMCHPILVDGTDRRKATARIDYQKTKGMLGL